ncbi:hypothetical protein TREMEDRAFT_62618 [Tremella mesenterica DSM 1558]|uniref:uncharacterized protein n=1 Tax=Tremella mesenterica (strain ATCC 24925 / CBS 8224 / DSM 1558 / NBRC 9311 / NRRL Y-6157 / RJB 2259-6 / UBC 559-6) TaxID=578456 RepID=UPI0003F48D2A|nr:uncharacterized protein TREMEDRAFT_62618 [Tremella mesenterica DSM 1558]EIW68901.1 hypothetical protein TREMEDRAFT_62618 [Tremella mesenterica DSM 1558]
MTSRPELDAYQVFVDRFTAARRRLGRTRWRSRGNLGALEMDVVNSDEEMDDVVDDEKTGGAGDDEEMGDVDDIKETGGVVDDEDTGLLDVSGELASVDRAARVAELKALSPIRITRGSPEARIIGQYSDGNKRINREIITYGRKRWPCLRPVKPHNCGSRCASCTSGPCSFCPPNTARDIPPRTSAPPPTARDVLATPFVPSAPPYTPSAVVLCRVPTAQDKEFSSPSPSANFSSPGPTSPSPAVHRPPSSPVAGPSRLPATPSAGPSRRTPRCASPAVPRPSTPVAGPSHLPTTPSSALSRPTRSRPTPASTQEDSPLTLPPALGTRSRQPSVPPATGLSTPALPVQTPPSKSPKGKGKKKKAVQFESAVVEN